MSILHKINAMDTINNEINALFYIFYIFAFEIINFLEIT